jgi:hypothetical protein
MNLNLTIRQTIDALEGALEAEDINEIRNYSSGTQSPQWEMTLSRPQITC